VFDLIEVDLANARESLEAGRLYGAALSAARALLVTRKLAAQKRPGGFRSVPESFVTEGLVDAALTEIIRAGSRAASEPDPAKSVAGRGPMQRRWWLRSGVV